VKVTEAQPRRIPNQFAPANDSEYAKEVVEDENLGTF
jgi:hypothetical protein